MNESQNAVRLMQCNKAPGPDVLPIEFYKAFFETNGDSGKPGIEPDKPGIDTGHPGEPGQPGIDLGSIPG